LVGGIRCDWNAGKEGKVHKAKKKLGAILYKMKGILNTPYVVKKGGR